MGTQDRTKYFDYDPSIVNATTRNLPPGDRSFAQVVSQSGKMVLDSEVNLFQDLASFTRQLLSGQTTPSGFILGNTHVEQVTNFTFQTPGPGFVSDAFHMTRKEALVAGFPVVVEFAYSDTAGDNLIQLDTATVYASGDPSTARRTDFVFLEVWQALVAPSLHSYGTITVNTPLAGHNMTADGQAFTAVAVPAAPDEFAIGGDNTATAINLAAVINAFPGLAVYAKAVGDMVYVLATDGGVAGDLIGFSSASPATLIPNPVLGFLAGGVDRPNKPDQNSIYRHGNVQSSVAVALDDDMIDPTVARETAQRVQVQYRIRVTGATEAVNYKTQMDGFSEPKVLAQGSTGAPVATYPFVPADGSTTRLNSDAGAYGTVDSGLWIAGDGTDVAAAALGTVDGYVYAIPIAFVFRHGNVSDTVLPADLGWDPVLNANGAPMSTHAGYVGGTTGWTVPATQSDRPDGGFCDAISETMLLDLRRHVNPSGFDHKAVLHQQMQSLLDGSFRTWAVDVEDKQEMGVSGDVSTQFLVCNEVGQNDTTRGETIGEFDHIRRRFADQSVVERVVVAYYPSDAIGVNPGKYVDGAAAFWDEDMTLVLDLDNLDVSGQGSMFHGDSPTTTSGIVFTTAAPPGTVITDVLSAYHDDGNWTGAVDQTALIKSVTGLGTAKIEAVLDFNDTLMTGGLSVPPAAYTVMGDANSTRRIFLEVEITYPLGVGLTDTPVTEVVPTPIPAEAWEMGPLVQNDLTQRPADMHDPTMTDLFSQPLPPAFREGYRETLLEYVGSLKSTPTDMVLDRIVSRTALQMVFPRRVWGVDPPTIQDLETLVFSNSDDPTSEYGSSSRVVGLDPGTPLSSAQTLCEVSYFAQDAISDYGALTGYQVSVYYRANAPQTFGIRNPSAGMSDPATGTLPGTLVVEPLAMSETLWTGQVGKGSQDLSYPYVSPLDQIPHYEGGAPTIEEWYYCATSMISVSDFNAEVGLLSLHPFVQADGSSTLSFGGGAAPLADAEFRAMYRVMDTGTYRPTVMAQPLAGAVRHKVFFPILARIPADVGNANGGISWRKGELVLIVISRLAQLDDQNTVVFMDTGNRTCAAVYRTRNLLLTV